MFKGSMVALVTPMHTDGSLDNESLKALIDWHIDAHTSAIIIAGTTGEASTLTHDEKKTLITTAIKHINGRVSVIIGTGTNATASTIEASKEAQALGADGLLIVTPYYNKPTQQGLYEHYKQVAAAVSIPIILYNVPGRTACDMLPETVAKLSMLEHIVGIKEATGKLERCVDILKTSRPGFEVYSGDDATGLDLMINGANGVISVTTNVAPNEMAAMCSAFFDGDVETAKKINAQLMGLHQKLFLESNPIPTKWALWSMGRIPSGIRLPLLPLDSTFHTELTAVLEQTGLTLIKSPDTSIN
jgi:4-hydroxy-tetrahydrodipicolinate synthase